MSLSYLEDDARIRAFADVYGTDRYSKMSTYTSLTAD